MSYRADDLLDDTDLSFEDRSMKSDSRLGRPLVLVGLVIFTVLVHLAFNLWYIARTPAFELHPMTGELLTHEMADLPVRDIASLTIGSGADFLRAPLFGVVEFVSYTLFGFQKSSLVLTVVLINAVLGAVLLYLILLRLLGPSVALIGGILNAIYFDNLIFPSLRASYGNFNFVLILGMIYLLLKYMDGWRSWNFWVTTLLVYGVALNMDSKLLLLPVLELGFLFLFLGSFRKIDFLRMTVCYLGFVVVLSPFLVRNYVYKGEFRPIQNNSSGAIAAAISKFDNPYIVNVDFPWIHTPEEAVRMGMIYSDSTEKAIMPVIEDRLAQAFRERPSLFVMNSGYNFIRIVMPWTLHNTNLKGTFINDPVFEAIDESSLGHTNLSGTSSRLKKYLMREFRMLSSVARSGAHFFVKVIVYLLPALLPLLYLMGAGILLLQRRKRLLLLLMLPVIYHAGTLTWLLVNPDYLLASYFTYLTLASIAIWSLWNLIRGRRIPVLNPPPLFS